MNDTTTSEQLASFAKCIYESGDLVEIRRLPSGRSSWHVATELSGAASQLEADNRGGQHIHIGINPRARRGGTKGEDVEVARVLVADFDDMSVDSARERWESLGLPTPTMVVSSGHGVHAYWRLEEPLADLAIWMNFQWDLATALPSDPAIRDPARLMRLPGFVNLKAPTAPCNIIDADPKRIHELAELHEHIPQRAETPIPAATALDLGRGGLAAIRGAAAYADKWPGVPQGHRDNAAQQHGAVLTRDFALSYEEALPILAGWNVRNSPPLEEKQLRKCLKNGAKYAKGEPGSKLQAATRLSNAPPTDSLPEDSGPDWFTIKDIQDDPHYRVGMPAITTGFLALDKELRGGFRPGCVYVIAGRTGASKSTMVLNIARRVALAGMGVLIHKLEESVTEAVWRIHAAASQVPLEHLLDGISGLNNEELQKLADGAELIRELPIRLSASRCLMDIQRISRAHAAAGGKLIIVDQLGMVSVPDVSSVYERVSLASNALRMLAVELRIPILIVCQINRLASRGKDALSVNDLRDSGHLENDAAAVILIDQIREPDGPQCSASELVRHLDLIVGKNRYGPRTDPQKPLALTWWPRLSRIEDVPYSAVEVEQ